MKTQKEILKWLQANLGKHCSAQLSNTDCFALVTSVNLCNLFGYSTAPPVLFDAYRAIDPQMQPHTRGLAYHAIAIELDWPHRDMIWDLARLAAEKNPNASARLKPDWFGDYRCDAIVTIKSNTGGAGGYLIYVYAGSSVMLSVIESGAWRGDGLLRPFHRTLWYHSSCARYALSGSTCLNIKNIRWTGCEPIHRIVSFHFTNLRRAINPVMTIV